MTFPRELKPRSTALLGLACDNRCIFCCQDGLADTTASPFALLPPDSTGEITFIGGEPTLQEELPGRIAEARAAGYRAIGLQTHGRHLANEACFDTLVQSGLTDLHLSIHGPNAAAHDYHVGHDGAFDRILQVLELARSRNITVVVSTVLTRSNHGVLAGLPKLLHGARVAAWVVTIPRAIGLAERDFDRIMPRLGLAMPYVLHAQALAGRLGLPAFIAGAPLCLLGPYTSRALPEPEPREFHEPKCSGCPARSRCPGVDGAYLRRFNGDELTPRTVGADHFAAQSTREAALLRMFVGTGPTATTSLPSASQASSPPPPASVPTG